MRSRPLLMALLLTVSIGVAHAADPLTWPKVAIENQPFTLSAATRVTYCNPAKACIAPRLLAAGAQKCDNATFAPDPYPGIQKECHAEPAQTLAKAPLCFPDPAIKLKVQTIPVNPGDFGGDDAFSVWACEKPDGTGYKNEAWLWSWSKIGSQIIAASMGVFNEAAAREYCNAKCIVPTPEEQGRAVTLAKPYLATATVTPNAASPAGTRPVYGLNPDGTRNTKAIAGAAVGANQDCDIGDRLPGTSYYSVAGVPNVFDPKSQQPLGASVYAQCTFKAPVGVNK